jgi:hypothetical protein
MAWVCGCSLAGIAGSNPAGDMNVSCECCVLSGRGLCVGLITRPEESYRVWCECDRETWTICFWILLLCTSSVLRVLRVAVSDTCGLWFCCCQLMEYQVCCDVFINNNDNNNNNDYWIKLPSKKMFKFKFLPCTCITLFYILSCFPVSLSLSVFSDTCISLQFCI